MTTNPSTTTAILAEEMAMNMHITIAGPLLDQGWSWTQIIAAIKACADLMPMVEQEEGAEDNS